MSDLIKKIKSKINDRFKYRSKKKYEVSCSFIDKYQFVTDLDKLKSEIIENLEHDVEKYSPIKRLELFTRFLNNEYLKLFNCEYTMYLELSDPQKLGYPRLHLHGWVRWDNPKDMMLWKLNNAYKISKYGNVQFNNYRTDYWPKYIKKDYYEFKKSLKEIDNCFTEKCEILYKDDKKEVDFFQCE